MTKEAQKHAFSLSSNHLTFKARLRKNFPGRGVPLNSWKACYIRTHFECVVNRDEASRLRAGEMAVQMGKPSAIQSF